MPSRRAPWVSQHGRIVLLLGSGGLLRRSVRWCLDGDVIAFRFGIPYAHTFGHRGFSHSIAFAALLATLAWLLLRNDEDAPVGGLRIWSMLFLATVSHGVLDAMTSGGLGVAFFSPFSNQRYFFDWRPIRVAPIGVGRFFPERGLAVLKNEFVYVWLPSLALIAVSLFARKPKQTKAATG